MNEILNRMTKKLLNIVTDFQDGFVGAYNIRENGICVARKVSDNISIESKTDKPGIDVHIKDDTKNEKVYIPACVTYGGIDDFVYNDIYVGENCDVTVISGCGVNTDDDQEAKHSGAHRFFIGKGSIVHYEEKHVGLGNGNGEKVINPITEAELGEDAYLEMNCSQISGITSAKRKTNINVAKGAKLVVHERLFTEKEQHVETVFRVSLNGEDSSADVVSRSVARDKSYQAYESTIVGKAKCHGHSECDSIIDEEAVVDSTPRLIAKNKEASLIHEAAIGKIAGEQLLKLRTLGLSEEEAELEIINGFLE